jgi:small subunit ribosomal protein S14
MAKKSMVAREDNRKYKVRVRNRCQFVDPRSGKVCGRPRGYIRRFGLCRIHFREMALQGKIPGVTKSSW